MVLYELQPSLEPFGEAFTQHRAVENFFRRVADRGFSDRAGEAGEELFVNRLVDDDRAQRGAALPGGAEAGEECAFHREIQVRVRHDDERVLAAELQARRLQVATAELPDPAPNLGGARKTDLIHEPLVQCFFEPFEGCRPLGLDYVQDAVR